MCAVCSDGFHKSASGTQCEECNSGSSWLDAFTMSIIFIVLVMFILGGVFIFKIIVRKEKVYDLEDVIGFLLIKFGLVVVNSYESDKAKIRAKIQRARRVFVARMKIYIAYFQILSMLSYVLDFNFPDIYNYIVSSVRAIVNLSVSGSAVVNCSFGSKYDFIDKLLFDTIYPVAVVLLVASTGTIHLRCRSSLDEHSKNKIRSNYAFCCLFFLYMTLPFTSSSIFQTFSCTNVDPDGVDDDDDDMYMTADYSVSCETARYRFGFIYALCAMFIYPIGIPALYFGLLYHYKDDISTRFIARDNTEEMKRFVRIRPYVFLFDNYKSDYWYWEGKKVHRILLQMCL